MGTGEWDIGLRSDLGEGGPQKGKITKKTRKEKRKGNRKWGTDIYGWDAGRKIRLVCWVKKQTLWKGGGYS